MGRLKHSCLGALVAVFASALAALILGGLDNQGKGWSFGSSEIPLDLLGISLAPGWLLMRGAFENVRGPSSESQILRLAILIPLISVVIDTGLIFVVWEFIHRTMTRRLDSDNGRQN
jgi:hypothetical protein